MYFSILGGFCADGRQGRLGLNFIEDRQRLNLAENT